MSKSASNAATLGETNEGGNSAHCAAGSPRLASHKQSVFTFERASPNPACYADPSHLAGASNPLAPSALLVVVGERIRGLIEHQREKTLDSIAESLLLEPDRFRQLIEEPYGTPDRAFVLDAIASLAYCQGVDPLWLLTGRYDPTLHWHVLSLSEERGSGGLARVREFVQERFERLNRNTPPLSFPGLGPLDSG